MSLFGLLVWLLIVVVVASAVLAVVRALLNLPIFANVQPYANVVYALVVLIIVLAVVSMAGNGVGFIQGGRPFFGAL